MNTVSSRAILLTTLIMAAAGCDPSSPPPTPPVSTPPKSTAPSPSLSMLPPPLNLNRCPPQLRKERVWTPAGYKTGPLWPLAHLLGLDGTPDRRGGWIYKLPWTTTLPEGELEVIVHRLDAPGIGEGLADRVSWESPPPGEYGFAGSIWVPSAGCWRVTGTVGLVSISVAFKVTNGP